MKFNKFIIKFIFVNEYIDVTNIINDDLDKIKDKYINYNCLLKLKSTGLSLRPIISFTNSFLKIIARSNGPVIAIHMAFIQNLYKINIVLNDSFDLINRIEEYNNNNFDTSDIFNSRYKILSFNNNEITNKQFLIKTVNHIIDAHNIIIKNVYSLK